jgi:hypothetical protein
MAAVRCEEKAEEGAGKREAGSAETKTAVRTDTRT